MSNWKMSKFVQTLKLITHKVDCHYPRCQYTHNVQRGLCCGWNKELAPCKVGELVKPLELSTQWKCCDHTGAFICNCPIVKRVQEELKQIK